MKKIVIPLTLILSIIAIANVLALMGNMNEKVQEGDIEGITEEVSEVIQEEVKEKVEEPFWILLIKQPLVWLLGAIGAIFGVKIVFR